MISSPALRLHAVRRLPNIASRINASLTPGHVALGALSRPRWTPTPMNWTWAVSRAKTTEAAKDGKQRFKYPEWLNVYRAGTYRTAFMGVFRVVTMVIFPIGCLYAPAFYFSPDYSSWWIIPYVVGAAVPMTAMMLATGPFVHAIKVRLPPSVRASREELIHFADNTPGQAEVRLECMRFLPWPTSKTVAFGKLRRYRPSLRTGYSNLEYVPEHIGDAGKYEGTWWYSVVRNFLGRFLVDHIAQDRSAAPGVWKKMWQQIPEPGSEGDPALRIKRERKPAVMANRPQRATTSPARPMPKSGGSKR